VGLVRSSLTGLCLAALSACAPTAPRDISQAIIGGSTATSDSSVVLVLIYMPAGSNNGALCTGSVVSPHVVLSAAHCVDPSIVGDNPGFYVFVGNDFGDSAQKANASLWYRVEEAHSDPAWAGTAMGDGHDVGVLVTKSAMPVSPVPMYRQTLPDSLVGQPVRLLGYGERTAGDVTTTGQREQLTLPVEQLLDQTFVCSATESDLCQGDSGGPTLWTVDGVEQIVGIHSYAVGNCAQGIDQRMDRVLSFVDPYIAMADPGVIAMPDFAKPLDAGIDAASTEHSGCSLITETALHGSSGFPFALLLFACAICRRRVVGEAA
jgi:V8-like Glu-specific endopeptidase